MKRNLIVLLGTLTLLACQKDQSEKPGSTTITGASTDAGVTVEQIRSVLVQQGPRGTELSTITITNDNGIVTLRGRVEDESTKRQMLNTVRGISNVKSVRDDLQVTPKQDDHASQGGAMQGGAMQGGSMQGDHGGTAGMPTGAHAGSTKTKNTDAVRSHLTQDKVAPTPVITSLLISDDGELVIISGIVPDQRTHDAVLKSAQKTPGVKGVRDDLKIKGE